ncbi:MAG: thiopurine S-methyltransferase [Steroidobacteraceae bacterium]|nr:thiopurine S-methyltransferase [Steroidobacteraceae bacterium]
MDPAFWLERWQRNEIGFHQAAPHKGLARHWSRLGLPRGARVFVPLAGKSLDMIWLGAQGHAVVGIELAAEAVRAFATEHGPLERVELRCGDLFDLDPASLGPIQGVFDRASLVALPPAMRRRYARKLAELSPPGTRTLLVTMEYDQARMPGPPHAVLESEVHELFGATHAVELLERDAALDDFPRFAQRGVDALAEAYFLLTRR